MQNLERLDGFPMHAFQTCEKCGFSGDVGCSFQTKLTTFEDRFDSDVFFGTGFPYLDSIRQFRGGRFRLFSFFFRFTKCRLEGTRPIHLRTALESRDLCLHGFLLGGQMLDFSLQPG